jgi:hypothetical protein
MDETDAAALKAFSDGQMTALELCRRLQGATYGDVLRLLSERNLPLPRAGSSGREADIQRARAWLFPKHAA